MGKKQRDKETKKNRGKSRFLWAGGAVALLAGGFLLWGWLSVVEPEPLAKSEPPAAGGGVRGAYRGGLPGGAGNPRRAPAPEQHGRRDVRAPRLRALHRGVGQTWRDL